MPTEQQEFLKSYLEQIVPENTLESVADDTEMPMRMTGIMPVEEDEAQRAHAAVRKLSMNQDLDNEEIFLIEAIIIPDKRPAVLIENGSYEVKHADWLTYNEGKAKKNFERAIASVGRIEIPEHPSAPYGGTGFVVGDNLIMTNRHVAELFASGLGLEGLQFKPGQVAAVDLKMEAASGPGPLLKVDEVVMIHPVWDMALLRMEALPTSAAPLTLSISEPEELVGRQIATIGYPAFDPRNNTEVQNKVFNGIYNVKRLQPGLFNKRSHIRHYGHDINAATHDASTLGGNSGCSVVDANTGEVLALHFGGRYKKTNYAVPAWELSRDEFVVNAGVNFGEDGDNNIEDPNPSADAWKEADQPLEVVSGKKPSDKPGGQSALQLAGGSTSITIPLEVTVSISSPLAGSGVTAQAATGDELVERMVEPHHDENYCGRPGYDPNFLGISVPMPKLTNTAELSALPDGTHILPYYHFSLAMHAKRRLAQVTAANVDTNPARLKPEPGKNYGRSGLNGFTSKNDRERWFTDPRIPAQHQLPDKFFTRDRKAFDKGHVVRRNAIVWGDSYKEVQLANGDSFHATNCSPQVKGFNRSNLNGLWGELENIVFDQAKAEKLCVLAGPVLHEKDPVFKGFDDFGRTEVQIPQNYWKVIAANDGGELKVFAFLLEQDLTDVEFEFMVDSEWSKRQVSLKQLEKTLKTVKFDKSLHSADQKK